MTHTSRACKNRKCCHKTNRE